MSLLAISTALSAQKPVELELWPAGAPNSNGITTPEQNLIELRHEVNDLRRGGNHNHQ